MPRVLCLQLCRCCGTISAGFFLKLGFSQHMEIREINMCHLGGTVVHEDYMHVAKSSHVRISGEKVFLKKPVTCDTGGPSSNLGHTILFFILRDEEKLRWAGLGRAASRFTC
jgi:hypothetical protein